MSMGTGLADEGREFEAKIEQALKDFRSSVHAWSEAEYSRPRAVKLVHLRSWRVAAGWALGCVLAAGSLAGAVYERHHRHELARIAAVEAAAQKAAQERAASEQAAAANALTTDRDLLATVDSDVSREVPAAMEPLAQMMDDDGTR